MTGEGCSCTRYAELQVMLTEHVRDALIGCKHCFLDKPCLGASRTDTPVGLLSWSSTTRVSTPRKSTEPRFSRILLLVLDLIEHVNHF